MQTPTYSFAELMLRIQQGDSDAFRVLLDEYGDAIQREVRFTLLDARLRTCVGESDVCQSVAFRFFSGMRDGQYRIETPKDLVRLLKGIARTRIAELSRYWHAQRRDVARNISFTTNTAQEACSEEPRAEHAVEQADLAEAADKRLSPRDRQILQWRDAGLSWQQIAERLDSTSGEAERKRHERSLTKIAGELIGTHRAGLCKPR